MAITYSTKLGKILNKVTPSDSDHYVEQRKLLWENASPTYSFAEQDLTGVDISPYSEIEVEYRFRGDNYEGYATTKGNIGDILRLFGCSWQMMTRTITTNKSTGIIHVNAGQYLASYGSSWTDLATSCTPYKIFGIKKLGGVVKQFLANLSTMLSCRGGGYYGYI